MTKLNLLPDDELSALIDSARSITSMGKCCPISCGINRAEIVPPCGAVSDASRVASFAVHRGEEPPVSGERGAGNVFFSGCALGCVFCQNYPFSALNNGKDYSASALADKIMYLAEKKKVHNINFTTADHYLLQTLKALSIIKNRISIPLSFNCSGYFTTESLSITYKVADIFLFDLKYSDKVMARKYSRVPDYVERSFEASDFFINNPVKWIENDDLLESGLIFRHLVLPSGLDNTKGVIDRLVELKSKGVDFRFSLMCQYFPAYKAIDGNFPELENKTSEDEYDEAVEYMNESGIDGWIQEYDLDGNC
ncbi:MAG TPA: 4Fe-4S cluster-binding domain-containing protein [Spirochaetota bacterium]|nr:4Fe-4S cluster-binding domain-containing protein [Spirochaetota bacterium]HOH36676.1 4Fe-4S cluster-binding domain-containing protein [Spirochaetota bacterium]HPJ13751.1 4Fe-4S cluster-binding domain-containing protein [Spirochaetota bacterium]HPM34817.1 4Fe-4S cluster-binding domain-containing protein [Spirochaetota bacterium]HPW51726.1 4Fe-4S cluster-binding domain-containing protein [Spirochaetota bacterium]